MEGTQQARTYSPPLSSRQTSRVSLLTSTLQSALNSTSLSAAINSSPLPNSHAAQNSTPRLSARATACSTTNASGGPTTLRTASIAPRFAPYPATRPRPYKPHLSPAASPLRPHCPARERLLQWKPLLPPQFPHESDDDRQRIFVILALAFSDSTLQTYGSGLLTFHVFCDSRSIAEALRAPASRSLISLFIASLAGLYSASAIANYIAGLRAWHTINRLVWCADEKEVETLIRGATAAAPKRTPARPPFTLDLLCTVLQQLDFTLSLDVAFAAALTSCFWGTARLGEIIVPKYAAFRADVHLTRRNTSQRVDVHGNSVTVLHIPRTKCAQEAGEDIYWAAQPGVADPRAALDRQLLVNAPDDNAHLFSYKGASGGLRPLTRHTFLARLKSAGIAAGVQIPPGHSLRIGSTTEYLLRGVPFDVMRAKGRWASDAFLKYLRKHAEIMAPYIQANPVAHAEFTRLAMPPVR